jgi:hypothetical protein
MPKKKHYNVTFPSTIARSTTIIFFTIYFLYYIISTNDLIVASFLLGVLGRLLVGFYLSLDLSSLCLLHQQLLAATLRLLGVDGLHQHSLVLELVTLGVGVQLVEQVLVDLLSLSVFSQQTTQHTQSSHPQHLERHTGVGSTLALTETSVSSLGLGGNQALVARLGVNHIGLADDETVLDQLAHVLSTVGVGDLGGLVRIHPNLALAALKDGSC